MQPCFYVKDAELIRKITITDFHHFYNHSKVFAGVDSIIERTVFALQGKEWKNMRMALGPFFTSSKIKMMYGLQQHEASDLVKHFEERANRGEKIAHEVIDIALRYTGNTIATAIMGFKADCVRNENSEIYRFMQKLMQDFIGPIGTLKFLLYLAFPKLYKLLGFRLVSQEVRDFFHHVVIETMNERDRLNVSRPDIIQLMLQAKKGQLENEIEINEKDLSNFSNGYQNSYETSTKKNAIFFTDDDWIAQGYIFFTAG